MPTVYPMWGTAGAAGALVDLEPLVAQVMNARQVLHWPAGTPALTLRATPVLTASVLNVVDAAGKTETQANLQATAAKINEIINFLNAAAQP